MKSLSSIGAKAGAADYRDTITATVRDPLALFTNFQWFVFRARNTVFYTAYSSHRFDEEMLNRLVARIVSLAPQLTQGFIGARPGEALPQRLVDEITSIGEVDSFEKFPGAWLKPGLDIYDTPRLPLFRVEIAIRRGGPDAEGRQSAILVRSSHALMEGSDSALINRSQFSGHGSMKSAVDRVPWFEKLVYRGIAAAMAPFHLVAAHFLSPGKAAIEFSTQLFERRELRLAAARLGVRQRSVMFALVLYAVFRSETGKPKKIRIAYTTLTGKRLDADDDFFRVRALDASHVIDGSLAEFVRAVDRTLDKVESRNIARRQFVLNAMFGAHRFLARILPFAYNQRFFRYSGPYQAVLTLVPPHRMYGNLTLGMLEPIYCGSYHPGTNLCTFVPARHWVSFSYTMPRHLLDRAAFVPELLRSLIEG
ncbi:MAG: hypothetical protein WEB63_10050 [Cucumibacter sp.]